MAKKKKSKLTIPGLSEDLKRFVKDLQNETDRGVALAAAEFIGDCLSAMLNAFFIDEENRSKELLDYLGTVSTLAARTVLAYALGFLGPNMYSDLKLIRQIRNEFAHSHIPVSFEEKKIHDKCLKLKTCDIMPHEGFSYSSRDHFIFASIMLANQIMLRGLSCKHFKCGKDFKLAANIQV